MEWLKFAVMPLITTDGLFRMAVQDGPIRNAYLSSKKEKVSISAVMIIEVKRDRFE